MTQSHRLNRRAAGIIGAAVVAVASSVVLLDSTDAQQTVTCDVTLNTIPGVGEIRFCAYAPAPATTVAPVVTDATTVPPTTVPSTTVPPTEPTTTTTTTTVAPVPAHQVLVGAAVERLAGETWIAATSRFEAGIGQPITIARRFVGSFPSTFGSVQAFAADVGLRDRFISVKGTPTLAQWVTFLQSVPVDGFDTWVTINHEPENDGASMTPTVYRSKLRLMHQALEQVNRADLHAGAVLMAWLERDGNPATSSAAWFPDADIIDAFTLGLDPYDPNNRQQFPDLVAATLTLWDAAGGRAWMVTETGTKRTGVDGVAWIDTMFAYCHADPDCGGVMWFHAVTGADGPWLITDPLMFAAYGRQAQFATAA